MRASSSRGNKFWIVANSDPIARPNFGSKILNNCDRFLFINRNRYILKLTCKEVWIMNLLTSHVFPWFPWDARSVHRQSLIQIFSPTRLSKPEYSEISPKARLDDLSAPLVPHFSIECHLHWSIGALATSNKLPLIQFLCRLSCWRKGGRNSMLGAISPYRSRVAVSLVLFGALSWRGTSCEGEVARRMMRRQIERNRLPRSVVPYSTE